MLNRDSADQAAASFPYFTEVDPELTRQSSGRDPLGMLPVWSEIGRGIVPYIASPVLQINGVKAVLLVHWLTEAAALQPLLAKCRVRGFFRLMEGLIEFWLSKHGHAICFGSQALVAGGNDFSVSITTGKTVANGLYQYYRGTCKRARLVDDEWRVDEKLDKLLTAGWCRSATDVLVSELGACLSRQSSLYPARVLANAALDNALQNIFSDDALHSHLNQLLGGDEYSTLAGEYLRLRSPSQSLRLDQRVAQLESDHLGSELDRVRRCEPFLLVLQDVFDLMRAAPGKAVADLASELVDCFPRMRARAQAFIPLGSIKTRRMRQMQELALSLSTAGADAGGHRELLVGFIRQLADYHAATMRERGRDAMVLIEGELIVSPIECDRDPADARKRLLQGQPWMNDYYLNTASALYKQLQPKTA